MIKKIVVVTLLMGATLELHAMETRGMLRRRERDERLRNEAESGYLQRQIILEESFQKKALMVGPAYVLSALTCFGMACSEEITSWVGQMVLPVAVPESCCLTTTVGEVWCIACGVLQVAASASAFCALCDSCQKVSGHQAALQRLSPE